jgi:hypothetical protein
LGSANTELKNLRVRIMWRGVAWRNNDFFFFALDSSLVIALQHAKCHISFRRRHATVTRAGCRRRQQPPPQPLLPIPLLFLAVRAPAYLRRGAQARRRVVQRGRSAARWPRRCHAPTRPPQQAPCQTPRASRRAAAAAPPAPPTRTWPPIAGGEMGAERGGVRREGARTARRREGAVKALARRQAGRQADGQAAAATRKTKTSSTSERHARLCNDLHEVGGWGEA